ncbi:hypothetical protein QR680_001943 [Steinernema hermaphroditum]|uniref:G-protein coupled receptors family 1 profile domain-containing protein n=1 Tax=Steinernema hermaphroditum TaxID=289476 RepID=A0AA39H1G9_9BILA|nr:hypothetical protein QR680_001943 [Steinernema hermaphroditum]
MLVVMLVIVLGNLLVVLTVNNDHKLRSQRQNWLIVSLAIADLLVGLLVMPLTMAYEIIGEWRLGNLLCELWLALDVLFVTASILHICIISLDRYWSVTQPLSYPNKRTPLRMSVMIGVSWLVSLLICLPPILGWRPQRAPGECAVSTDVGYVLYSALGSFYIPVIILVIVYARIFSITKQHSRQRLKETERTDKTLCQLAAAAATANSQVHNKAAVTSLLCSPGSVRQTTSLKENSMPLTRTGSGWEGNDFRAMNGGNTENESPTSLSNGGGVDTKEAESNRNPLIPKKCIDVRFRFVRTFRHRLSNTSNQCGKKRSNWLSQIDRSEDSTDGKKSTDKRRRLLKAKERQATMLLGLILTAFIASWLPFFVMYVLGAFGYEAPELVFKFFFWLGYCNSGINPVIYTVFNREFKRALCRQLRKQQRYVISLREHFL